MLAPPQLCDVSRLVFDHGLPSFISHCAYQNDLEAH